MRLGVTSVRVLAIGTALVGSLLANSAEAQQTPKGSGVYEQFVRKLRIDHAAPKTICYKSEQNAFTQIAPPEAFLRARQNPNLRKAATATFLVTYNGFTPEAQKAFQYAVDIWSTLISSPVPIRIQANWVSQSRGVLGSAGPAEIRAGFELDSGGAQKAYGLYPIALAEKIARRELNSPTVPDIKADFNQNNNWYYGIDQRTPAGQSDLVTVVLHEIGHGLGFIGYFGSEGTSGTYLTSPYSSVFDHFIETNQGQRLVAETTTFPDNSIQLFRQLTGDNLFLNGPILRKKTGTRAKLYAPSVFDRGSSLYHLDETNYARSDINSLMTPKIANAEAIHSPGPLVLSFLEDIEWKTTSLLHKKLASTEDDKDAVFRVTVVSDTLLTPGSVRLLYRKSAPTATDTAFTAITPTLVAGSTSTYTYTMPANVAKGDIWYYFRVQDASGRTFTNPGKLPNNVQDLHNVRFGPDNVPPTIAYSPTKNFIFNPAVADSLPVNAGISDDRSVAYVNTNIDSVYIDYQVNGVNQPKLPLVLGAFTVDGTPYDSIYSNRIVFPANSLKAGDKITYRIVARDASRAKNQTVSPKTGFYELTVVAPKAPVDRYVNTFQDASAAADFAGYRFGIATPSGFADPAVHSEHPYQNGSDFKAQSNYEYVLLAPVRIKTNPDSAVMRFDEIVLVEPSDAGSEFGKSGFYDYVVVEGSSDNGRTWKPFLTGYNSNNQYDWYAAYNNNLVKGATAQETNSATVGTPALYKRHEFSLVSNGNFKANDQVLIRFRLFADQLAHGWGWAIDNLQIQVPAPPVLANEPISAGTFSVYPNPISSGSVQLEAELIKPVSEVGLSITGATGQMLRQLRLKVSGRKLSEQVDMSQLPTGIYFLKLQTGESVLTQKVIIAR
ncbi:T9SS type A sorting domain-containing protein [Spirosoma sp. RP8]|uniref:T9SS type A sorting domain-containing protein n=1 Tax=Spirosoma liriopis TaxID=2937440 RepID=A0ABT0HIE9_9BACT|nr:T9SS type A sorting domain-containing protein [Spirosoma liriopis]MCK8491942.1 T9SS type A sorting domain-containing protein [Spirosoma liriopis]